MERKSGIFIFYMLKGLISVYRGSTYSHYEGSGTMITGCYNSQNNPNDGHVNRFRGIFTGTSEPVYFDTYRGSLRCLNFIIEVNMKK